MGCGLARSRKGFHSVDLDGREPGGEECSVLELTVGGVVGAFLLGAGGDDSHWLPREPEANAPFLVSVEGQRKRCARHDVDRSTRGRARETGPMGFLGVRGADEEACFGKRGSCPSRKGKQGGFHITAPSQREPP